MNSNQSLSLPQSSGSDSREYPINIEGQALTFIGRLPAHAMADLSDPSNYHVYIYSWIDSERGQGCRVHYKPCDIASCEEAGGEESQKHNGSFSMTLFVRDGDPDLLKVMACFRMKDDETNNKRTTTLATSAISLEQLLQTGEQRQTMYSQFDIGNYVEVVLRVTNTHDYANSALTTRCSKKGLNESTSQLPFIRFERSALWDIESMDADVQNVSNSMRGSMRKYAMKDPPGGASFRFGETRYVCCDRPTPPSSPYLLPTPLLFLCLCLGTPACSLFPLPSPSAPCRPCRHPPTAGNSQGLPVSPH